MPRQRPDHQRPSGQVVPQIRHDVAQLTLTPVSLDGAPETLAGDHGHLRRLAVPPMVQDDGPRPHPAAGADRGPDPRSRMEASVVGQHRHTERRVRPLLRRDEMMERPARVRMRRRKPCFLCRRRLFGWYVRFMLSPSKKPSAARFRSALIATPAMCVADAGRHRPVHSAYGTPDAAVCAGSASTPPISIRCSRHADPVENFPTSCGQSVVRRIRLALASAH
jgi:hypothetical protein